LAAQLAWVLKAHWLSNVGWLWPQKLKPTSLAIVDQQISPCTLKPSARQQKKMLTTSTPGFIHQVNRALKARAAWV